MMTIASYQHIPNQFYGYDSRTLAQTVSSGLKRTILLAVTDYIPVVYGFMVTNDTTRELQIDTSGATVLTWNHTANDTYFFDFSALPLKGVVSLKMRVLGVDATVSNIKCTSWFGYI